VLEEDVAGGLLRVDPHAVCAAKEHGRAR
jgi:hypothetical protein